MMKGQRPRRKPQPLRVIVPLRSTVSRLPRASSSVPGAPTRRCRLRDLAHRMIRDFAHPASGDLARIVSGIDPILSSGFWAILRQGESLSNRRNIQAKEVGMRPTGSFSGVLAVAAMLAALLAWPMASEAQTVTGRASAVKATVLGLLGGTTTVLADTGALAGSSDALQASALTGGVPALLTGETLHATTIGWPDQVVSRASLAALALTVAGTRIGADLISAQARAAPGAAGSGASNIENLAINGVSIPVRGGPNQTVPLPRGLVGINEQQTSPTSTLVNALHVPVYRGADLGIGSATAGIY